MKIKQKLILAFFINVLLFGLVGSVAVVISENALQKSIGENSVFLAGETIDKIDRDIYNQIQHWKFVSASSRWLQEDLLSSNQKFDEMADSQEFIQEKDKEWISVGEKETIPLMQELTNNKLSKLFKLHSDFYKKEEGYTVIGEIFATNKYGVNVGETGRTSDYYQADEEWWQIAKEDGLYIGDVKYDESAGIYSMNICTRVDDNNGNFLGVVKVVLNIDKVIEPLQNLATREGYIAKQDIKQRAKETAAQVGNYIKDHPDMTISDLQANSEFQNIAVQKVGETGYTALTDYDTLICRFHKSPEIVDLDLHKLSEKLPGFWGIMSQTKRGIEADGCYDWEDADGTIRDKYMYIALVDAKTADNVRLHVAATTYVNEFRELGYCPEFKLLTEDGRILYSTEEFEFLENVPNEFKNYVIDAPAELGHQHYFIVEGERLCAFARSSGYKDYKGLGWILVVAHDVDEIFAPVAGLRKVIAGTFFFALMFIFLINYFVRKAISKPIKKLQGDVEIIEKGNLDHKAAIDSQDEIGQLSRAFDKMTESIKKSRAEVDVKVEHQTKEIQAKNRNMADQQKAILNILDDIGEEKSNVLKEKNKIDAILHSIGDGVFVIDKNFKIFIFNRAAAEISGFDGEKILSKRYDKILKFVNEKDGQNCNSFIKEAMERSEVVELPMYCALIRKDKENVAVAAIAAPLKDKEGKAIGCVVVFRDIAKERAIDKAKSEFVSLASHQLRTPLSAISWYAEMLLDGDAGKINKKQKEYLDQIYAGNRRMVDLVNALLNVSRLELGTFIIEPESLDITQISKDAVVELAVLLKKKNIKIIEKYDKLPKIKLDKKLTHIIFQNLLSNAVKYSPKGSKININILKNEDDIQIEVADKGMGIPKNEQDKMFSKLFRASNVKIKDTVGTGLGLYIIKSILDHSGGKIWFKSEENKGTTFYVKIPLKGMERKEGNRALS